MTPEKLLYAGVTFGLCILIFEGLLWLRDQFERKADPPTKQVDPHWESVPAYDDVNGVRQLVGYQVRWSKPDSAGCYLWVGHYYAGEDVSLGWCGVAAESQATRFNETGKLPWEFSEWTPKPDLTARH